MADDDHDTHSSDGEDDSGKNDDASETEYEEGAIKKKILTKGTGWEKPTPGAEVSVHYVGTLLDGTKFDSSRDRDELFKFKLGQGSVIKGWDKGVATMKKGEKSLFTIAASHAYGTAGSPPKIPANATLQFEIELISWTSEEDVTPGGEVKKTVLHEGKGWEKPGELAKCTVKLSCQIQGESKYVIGQEAPKETELDLTSTDLPEGLVEALQKMKKEERAKVVVQPEFGYGEMGNKELKIPPNATLVYDIELVNFTDAPKTWSMKVEEKLEHCAKLKDVGNAFFHKNNLKRARHFYDEAAKLFAHEKTLEGENKQKADQLQIQSKGNLAACTLKAGDYPETVKVCSEVLQLDASNVKVLFRRAQAHFHRKDNDEALEDLQQIIAIEGKPSAVVAKLLREVKAEIAKERNAQAKLFGGMFKKVKLVSEEELAESKKASESKPPVSDSSDDDMPAVEETKEATEKPVAEMAVEKPAENPAESANAAEDGEGDAGDAAMAAMNEELGFICDEGRAGLADVTFPNQAAPKEAPKEEVKAPKAEAPKEEKPKESPKEAKAPKAEEPAPETVEKTATKSGKKSAQKGGAAPKSPAGPTPKSPAAGPTPKSPGGPTPKSPGGPTPKSPGGPTPKSPGGPTPKSPGGPTSKSAGPKSGAKPKGKAEAKDIANEAKPEASKPAETPKPADATPASDTAVRVHLPESAAPKATSTPTPAPATATPGSSSTTPKSPEKKSGGGGAKPKAPATKPAGATKPKPAPKKN